MTGRYVLSMSASVPRAHSLLAITAFSSKPNFLVALVWGERAPRTAVARLQAYVHELRALVGKERISRVGAGHRIHTGADELDLRLFERYRTAARADAGEGRHAELHTAGESSMPTWATITMNSGHP